MNADLTAIIAEVLAKHVFIESEYRTDCSCGENFSAPAVSVERELHAAHQAEQIAARLGIEQYDWAKDFVRGHIVYRSYRIRALEQVPSDD